MFAGVRNVSFASGVAMTKMTELEEITSTKCARRLISIDDETQECLDSSKFFMLKTSVRSSGVV
jgi:hypothetical protein